MIFSQIICACLIYSLPWIFILDNSRAHRVYEVELLNLNKKMYILLDGKMDKQKVRLYFIGMSVVAVITGWINW